MTGRASVRGILVLLLLLPLLLLLDGRRASPVPHRAEWLEAAGLRWRAIRAGKGDTTVVLLHGYGEHLLTWRGVFDRLAAHHRLLAVDLPGFGVSDKPDSAYTLEVMTGYLEALLERWTTGAVILIGHSMGGEIALAYALDHPDQVAALGLIAPAGLRAGLGDLPDELGRAGRAAIGWWESLRAFVTPVHDPGWLEEPDAMAEYDPLSDPAYRASAGRVLQDFDFEALGPTIARFKGPVLLLWGRHDPVIPFRTADRFRALLSCARFEPLATLHRPQAERPDTVATLLLDFLSRPGCGA